MRSYYQYQRSWYSYVERTLADGMIGSHNLQVAWGSKQNLSPVVHSALLFSINRWKPLKTPLSAWWVWLCGSRHHNAHWFATKSLLYVDWLRREQYWKSTIIDLWTRYCSRFWPRNSTWSTLTRFGESSPFYIKTQDSYQVEYSIFALLEITPRGFIHLITSINKQRT